jgi:hypothetical protein
MKRTEKDFYKSQNTFSEFRQEKHANDNCVCFYQAYDLQAGILVEKWNLGGHILLVEFYPDGNGFCVYQ